MTATANSVAASRGLQSRHKRPAATAATRLARAELALGALGVVSCLFVVTRLFESWRVTPRPPHEISILSQKLSYPAANLGAIVVLCLACVGLVSLGLALVGAATEAIGSRRLHRLLVSRPPVDFGDALLIPDDRPRAFCAGLFRPRIYVTTGAVALLDHAALEAVLAHERHHVRRHDPLRLAVGRTLARALFFVPGLSALSGRRELFAELSADEDAIGTQACGRAAMARAMLGFADAADGDHQLGVDAARVDQLLGDARRWRFPIVMALGCLAAIALVAATAQLAGRVASGSATLALPFLSSRPCVLTLAMVPCAGLIAAVVRRTRSV